MTEGPTELLPSAASAGPRLELPNGEPCSITQTVKMAYCIIAYVASDYHQTGHNTQPFKPFSLSFFLILLIVVGR